MWMLAVPAALAGAGFDEVHERELRSAIAEHVDDPEIVGALVDRAKTRATELRATLQAVGPADGVGNRYVEHVAASLRDKAMVDLRLPQDTLGRTVIDYEAFKASAYVTSGVFPKRYFGFFDLRHDTAAQERTVLQTTRACVRALNALQAKRKRSIRLTEIEVAVTFYAEGGAIWLADGRPLHPVFDVGLDDLARGWKDQPEALRALDDAASTKLGTLVAWANRGDTTLPTPTTVPPALRWLAHDNGDAGPFPYLTRLMTLEEAVAGTALMYLWEKERAERLLAERGEPGLMGRTLDEQFVISSLVYNSGLLHASARWAHIQQFDTGADLHARSRANRHRRPELNLQSPAAQLSEWRSTGQYRPQYTSWLAVYHILQRYGAFAALRRFTDRFDERGRYTAL